MIPEVGFPLGSTVAKQNATLASAAREELNSIELIPDTSEDTGIDIEEVEREVEQLLEKSLTQKNINP
jgi:hypothetical protein